MSSASPGPPQKTKPNKFRKPTSQKGTRGKLSIFSIRTPGVTAMWYQYGVGEGAPPVSESPPKPRGRVPGMLTALLLNVSKMKVSWQSIGISMGLPKEFTAFPTILHLGILPYLFKVNICKQIDKINNNLIIRL